MWMTWHRFFPKRDFLNPDKNNEDNVFGSSCSVLKTPVDAFDYTFEGRVVKKGVRFFGAKGSRHLRTALGRLYIPPEIRRQAPENPPPDELRKGDILS